MNDSKSWFEEARYGMFIHWGPYSVAARGEWAMNRERISAEEYTALYVEKWRAENYNPTEWAQLAKDAGMGYVVLTTRHHDGFALWDSKVTDFNAAKLGPQRDLLLPYVEAMRAAGLKVGFYYSPASWPHPDYPGPFFRDWPSEQDWPSEEARQRFIQYYRSELKELLTGYGKIDYLWFDGGVPRNLDGEKTLAMVREWQPGILVNDRLGKPFDVQTCEQGIHPAQPGQAWEACMTLNDNWGYHDGDSNWKQPYQVVEMLLRCAENGGNLLLNIGPKADGSVPEEMGRILREAGAWIQRNRAAVAGSERHPFSWNMTARPITAKGSLVYLHFFKDPNGSFCWAEAKNRLLSARLLADGRPVSFTQEADRIFLNDLPTPMPDAPTTTIVLQFEGELEAVTPQTCGWIPG